MSFGTKVACKVLGVFFFVNLHPYGCFKKKCKPMWALRKKNYAHMGVCSKVYAHVDLHLWMELKIFVFMNFMPTLGINFKEFSENTRLPSCVLLIRSMIWCVELNTVLHTLPTRSQTKTTLQALYFSFIQENVVVLSVSIIIFKSSCLFVRALRMHLSKYSLRPEI